MQGTEMSVSGLIRFYTKDELKRYLKTLVEQYQGQNQKYGDQLGGLLRTLEQEKAAAKVQTKDAKAHADPKTPTKGWVKMGTVLVNSSDPSGAMAEVLYQLHEEVKTRLAKTSEALKSFEDLNSTNIPEAGLYYLQLKNGVPERIIVDLSTTRKEAFNYSADFKLV
ncbi:MAG: hypothetical protein KGI38_10770 [Thaumarchaeota archaeon]|nr:hypothetical protein [Nitrososphaerota archaeon]